MHDVWIHIYTIHSEIESINNKKSMKQSMNWTQNRYNFKSNWLPHRYDYYQWTILSFKLYECVGPFLEKEQRKRKRPNAQCNSFWNEICFLVFYVLFDSIDILYDYNVAKLIEHLTVCISNG